MPKPESKRVHFTTGSKHLSTSQRSDSLALGTYLSDVAFVAHDVARTEDLQLQTLHDFDKQTQVAVLQAWLRKQTSKRGIPGIM